jgi:hypothetical protein
MPEFCQIAPARAGAIAYLVGYPQHLVGFLQRLAEAGRAGMPGQHTISALPTGGTPV